jgi:hypothetical protein
MKVLTIFLMICMIVITHATQISNEPSAKMGITPICRDLQQLGHRIAEAEVGNEAGALVQTPSEGHGGWKPFGHEVAEDSSS